MGVTPAEGSTAFWDALYREGGGSGTGSIGRLAVHKAAVVNALAHRYGCGSVIDFGSGDGVVASLVDVPSYTGVDASPTAVDRCRHRFEGDDRRRFLTVDELDRSPVTGDLATSLDVIYHLLEDDVFDAYMRRLFAHAGRVVAIYSDDIDDEHWPGHRWDEVRHRRFTPWIAEHAAGWRLAERIPNPFPWVDGHHDTSWADFFVFLRVR